MSSLDASVQPSAPTISNEYNNINSEFVNTNPTSYQAAAAVKRNEQSHYNYIEMALCLGFCCCNISLFIDLPSCSICTSDNSCCCLKFQGICCQLSGEDKSKCCIINSNELVIKAPNTIVKNIIQCLCIDVRCAIPCDEDVTCNVTLLPCCVICSDGKCKLDCNKKFKVQQ